MAIVASWDVRHNGELIKAGEVIDILTEKEEQRLIEMGVAQRVFVGEEDVAPTELSDSSTDNGQTQSMTIEQLTEYLATAEYIDDVEDLLKEEIAKKEPRKTAVKMLEEWLKESEQDENNSEGDQDGEEQ